MHSVILILTLFPLVNAQPLKASKITTIKLNKTFKKKNLRQQVNLSLSEFLYHSTEQTVFAGVVFVAVNLQQRSREALAPSCGENFEATP